MEIKSTNKSLLKQIPNKKRHSKLHSGFKSYVTCEEYDGISLDISSMEINSEEASPHLLPGEIVIAHAHNVLMFAILKTNKTGISGSLYITNLKLSFISSIPLQENEEDLCKWHLQCHKLGPHDVCLSEIDQVYQTSEVGNAKRKLKLMHNSAFHGKIPGLQIILKNFRVINLSFKFTPIGEDVRITHAILHHAFPTNINCHYLSCGYEPPTSVIPQFCYAQDWEVELKRTGCPNWRVSICNEFYNLCSSLPFSFVVPSDLVDVDVQKAAQHFQGNRAPVWCWGSSSGAALVRMAQVSSLLPDRQIENWMMQQVHNSHPLMSQPQVYDLDKLLPSLKDVCMAFTKLQELHTPDDVIQYKESMNKLYLSKWESSKWMSYVSQCLHIAKEVVVAIAECNMSVILQEGEGRDYSAVIASLAEIILDPYYHTVKGFHSLIQKEWVALGHPFCTRLGHTRHNSDEKSPLWLLFLDCVHQVGIQNSDSFEFSSHYLVALWTSAHCSLFSTFMFNSLNHRHSTVKMLREDLKLSHVVLWSLWSWWNFEACSCEQSHDTNDLIIRNNQRRSDFLNAYYAHNLIDRLTSTTALSSVVDPVSNMYHIWHKVKSIVVDPGPLYDEFVAPRHFTLDQVIAVDEDISSLCPWIECFAQWLADPFYSEVQHSICGTNLYNYQARKKHWLLLKKILNSVTNMFDINGEFKEN